MALNSLPAPAERELFHLSLNDDREETIVLLHGLLSSHLEYAHVIPHLKDYHILAVDLSGHARSSDILPASISASADRVATLIRRHAHGGNAHVVGLSMGGFVTADLVRRNPELVRTAFTTGAAPFQGFTQWLAEHPSVVWAMMTVLLRWTPDWLYWKMAAARGLLPHEELLKDMRANMRWDVVREVYATILDLKPEDVKDLNVRFLAVAGGLNDDVPSTKKMGKTLPVEGSRAVVVKDAVHSWDLQFPELFADGVLAWIEGRPLPERFDPL
jgi:pimeloyl-ACP methyl ester carboxylesterase